MRTLPIVIHVAEIIDGTTSQVLYHYTLEINYNRQGYVLGILDEEIKKLVRDFDLSKYSDKIQKEKSN